ncbi:MAG: response regulator transcription factor [Terriglobia bacterium]|jgi:DNA-binding response OmpR family regulator
MSGQSESASNARIKVLIVDDDRKLCRLIRDYLEPLGYEVSAAYTGPEGLEVALHDSFSAVILDVMLPGMNGFDVLRRLREKSRVPVLMLTGRGEEADRIVGLEMGADDYLPKTFSTRELLARLRAVMRRSMIARTETEDRLPAIVVGDLHVDPEARTAALDDQPLQLTAVEFDLLLSLAKSAGRVRTREQLLNEVADRNFDVFDRSIDVHISSLRRKLGDDPKSPRFIATVRSAGYMLRKPGSEVLA